MRFLGLREINFCFATKYCCVKLENNKIEKKINLPSKQFNFGFCFGGAQSNTLIEKIKRLFSL